MTNAQLRRAVRRARARKPEQRAHAARHGPRGLDPGGDRGSRAPARARARDGDRRKNLCLAGGVALNCVANGKVLRDGRSSASGSSRRRATPAARSGAALVAYHLFSKAAALSSRNGTTRCAARYLGPRSPQADIERACAAAGARFDGPDEDRAARQPCATALAEGKARRLVPGPHGVRPARARRRSILGDRALADDAEDAEPQGQVPRVVPAVRAVGAARGRGRLVRARRRQSRTCCWSPTWPSRRRAMTPSEQALFGIEKLNVPRSRSRP